MSLRHRHIARHVRLVVAASVALAVAASVALQSGAQAASVPDADPGATTRAAVAFAMPAASTLRASKKKVFAHYMPSAPVSLDNRDPSRDIYATQYLTPGGENGKHAAYGGFMRDRPEGRPARTEQSWALADAVQEIREAQGEGIDGFTLDLLQLPGDPSAASVWTHTQRMMKAADTVGGFDMVLMPDMSASAASQSAATLARYVAQLGQSRSAYRLADGRLVVSPFVADRQPVSFWASFNAIMANTYHQPVALVPLFLNEMNRSKAYAPVSYGMSNWGARSPELNNPAATYGSSQLGRVAQIHKLGKVWMQPVSVQDARPRSGLFEEAQNTQNLRNTWEIAIKSNSEWVQLATWNDYTEGTHMAPSERNGSSWLDIDAYYLTWFKTGVRPAIARDTVYLTHRNEFTGTRPSFPQKVLMNARSGKPRNTIEALTFLGAPGTVTVTAGSMTRSCNVPAGVGVCTVPLALGEVAAAVTRAGATVASVTSPVVVTATPTVQDLEYVASSSGRTGFSARVVHATPAAPAKATTVTVAATADTYVAAAAPRTTFGTKTSLVSAAKPGALTYLRFTLPKAPKGKTLRSVTLKVRTTTAPAAGSRAVHDVKLVPGTWSESSLRWSNRRPAGARVGAIVNARRANTSYAAALDPKAIGRLSGSQTLAVTTAGADSLVFWSSNYGNRAFRPQLVLTYR